MSRPVVRNVRLITWALVVASLVGLRLVEPTEAAGPWTAQVVSAETQQPLEGVVVLAWWTRHVRSFGGPSAEYRDSQEVLTDRDGRFTIAPRFFFSLNPLVFFRGPFFVIFKSGYGGLQWMSSKNWPKENQRGRVLQMPRLEDIHQRRDYVDYLADHIFEVPRDKRPLLDHAIVEEQKALGSRSR